jgi:hypothetical protein
MIACGVSLEPALAGGPGRLLIHLAWWASDWLWLLRDSSDMDGSNLPHDGPRTAIAIANVPRPILAVPVEHYRNRPGHWESTTARRPGRTSGTASGMRGMGGAKDTATRRSTIFYGV